MTRVQHSKQQPSLGKPNVPNVRPEIAALSRRIVAEDREALEILAAYDRGEAPATSDQQQQAASSPPAQTLAAPIKQ